MIVYPLAHRFVSEMCIHLVGRRYAFELRNNPTIIPSGRFCEEPELIIMIAIMMVLIKKL